MLLLAIILLITSLAIAGIAGYFSIIGLSLLFVGSGLSIIVMGAALEVGKLVAVTALHHLWKKLNFLLKTYLFLASFILSVITSIGIYGYLSNGYNATSIKVRALEQNKNLAVQKINELKTTNDVLTNEKPSTKLTDDTTKENADFAKQQIELIGKKELRIQEIRNSIDSERKKSIEEQNNAKLVLDSEIQKELQQITLFNNRLQILDKEVQVWMDQGTGGLFKQNGLEKARQVKESQQKERDAIDNQIKNAQIRIDVLRTNYTNTLQEIQKTVSEKTKISESNIQKIEQEIAVDKQAIIDNQKKSQTVALDQTTKAEELLKNNKEQIKNNLKEIETLTNTIKDIDIKINDTDVGTFKFVAKNFNLELDKTVNWFIIMIISVFDPLAVTLLLCFNYIIKLRSEEKKKLPVVSATTTALPTTITTTLQEQIQEANKTDEHQQLEAEYQQFYEHLENGKIAYKPFKPAQEISLPVNQAST